MLLEKIKNLLGLNDIPNEIATFYQDAVDERHALLLLKEARRRDTERQNRILEDISILQERENQYIQEGLSEMSLYKKKYFAKKIKQIREKIAEINFKMENIFEKRIKIYNEHISALETIAELKSEPLPSAEEIENIAIKAREKLEHLDKSLSIAEAVKKMRSVESTSEEENEILKELGAEELYEKSAPVKRQKAKKIQFKKESPKTERKKEEKMKEEE